MRVNKSAYGSIITPYNRRDDRLGARDADHFQFLSVIAVFQRYFNRNRKVSVLL
jgi:hypothetical protein